MLYSYKQAANESSLAAHTTRFVQAAAHLNTPQGVVLGPQALESFTSNLVGVSELLQSVSDEGSVARVDEELRRRFITGRIPDDVSDAIHEALDILGLDEELRVSDIPLIAMLSTDQPLDRPAVIINVVGKKSLADAIRTLYARLYTHPYPTSTPNASIVLYRMPPASATAKLTLSDDTATVHAVHGWGMLVGTEENADTFTLKSSGALVSKNVAEQDSMVYRNPRSGEIVQTRPKDARSQKITDEEARTIVLLAKKVGLSESTFAVSNDHVWLMSANQSFQAPPKPIDEPEVAPPSTDESTDEPQEEAEVIIVDLEDEPEAQQPVQEPQQHTQEEVDEPQQPISQPEANKQTEDDQVTDTLNADEHYQQASKHAKQLLEHVHLSIELSLREFLDEEFSSSFEELVKRVSARRQVPYKNRILTLHEMNEQGAFEQPSPEAIRFALETLERFRREFSS